MLTRSILVQYMALFCSHCLVDIVLYVTKHRPSTPVCCIYCHYSMSSSFTSHALLHIICWSSVCYCPLDAVYPPPPPPCTVLHHRGLVCLTCWLSVRVLEPLSCTSTKVESPSMPSAAVWREYATVHPLRICQLLA